MKEVHVDKLNNGEVGSEIITPFITHLNARGEECGVLVNRGWVPKDYIDKQMHYLGSSHTTITGLLYRGDPQTKYSEPNTIIFNEYTRADPSDISIATALKNPEAS